MKVKVNQSEIKSNYGASLLRARGIDDVNQFINPDESCLQDWRHLENIDEGVKLIKELKENSKIGLIVDCDCDGYTSSAIFYQYLKRLKPSITIDYYIHKGKAHGLEEHWEELIDREYDLLVLPDSGSNDSVYADKLPYPILVLDHHLVDEEITAKNMIVINNQLSPLYTNKNLSGAGVVFQFCRALDFYFQNNWANDYIDLAALGVLGDMMSGLELENQFLWKTGFSKINNYFFLSMARKQGYSITGKVGATDKEIIKSLNPTSVAFYIVPLINATVRMGSLEEKKHMFEAFVDGHKLIPSKKRGAKGALEEVAVESVRESTNARAHQNKFLDEASEILEQKIFKYDLLENKILFVRLDEEDFPSELNGLLAMRLSQKYKHPTIVARLNEEGYIRGSARGLNNSELTSFKNFLTETGLFEYAQGHEQAFGCSIANNNLFKLHQLANEQLKDIDFNSDYYEVDFMRQAMNEDLEDLIMDLDQYKDTWSQNNPQPLVYIKDLHITWNDIQIMGKNANTIKITKNGISYLKFFATDLIKELEQYQAISMEIVGKPNLNEWNGRYIPQFIIESCEVKEEKIIDF